MLPGISPSSICREPAAKARSIAPTQEKCRAGMRLILLTRSGSARSQQAPPPITRPYGGALWTRRRLPPGAGMGVACRPFCLASIALAAKQGRALECLRGMCDAIVDQASTIGAEISTQIATPARGAPAQAWSVACTLDAWRLRGRPSKMRAG